MFGDQSLKPWLPWWNFTKFATGVIRQHLQDLKFTGQWDQLWLRHVRYICNPAGGVYYVEVTRGWVGKPDLAMPEEFWRGTGYSTALKSAVP